jgi:hypothetical protein
VCHGPDEGSIKFATIIKIHESSNQGRDENQLSFIIKSTPYHVAEIIKCASNARLLSFLSAGTNGMPYSCKMKPVKWVKCLTLSNKETPDEKAAIVTQT